MQYSQDKSSSNHTHGESSSNASGSGNTQLKGMSYEAGRQALSPQTGGSVQHAAVQLKSTNKSKAKKIIERYTDWGGLNLREDALGSYLMSLLPGSASLVNAVFTELGSVNRDDVAYYAVEGATDKELQAVARGGAKWVLFRMMRELQNGSTVDSEAKQIERIVRASDPAYGRLKGEKAGKDPRVTKSLKAAGASLQSISDGSGDYIYDEYSVIIDQMPSGLTPEEYLGEMGTDLNKTVHDDMFDTINMFKRRATTKTPEVGNIYDINIMGPDNGSVVLVEKTSSYFVFQTITTKKTGTHPEYGSRQFGFTRLRGGAVKFYTKGASRPANAAVGAGGRLPQTIGWTRLMRGISDSIQDRGGRPRPGSFKSWTSHRT